MKFTRWTVFFTLLVWSPVVLAYWVGYGAVVLPLGVVALVVSGLLLVGPHGLNYFDRRKVHQQFRHPIRVQNDTYQMEEGGAGFVLDGKRFSMYIEVTGKPYAMSRDSDSAPVVPLGLLRQYLSVYGVKPWSINTISYAVRTSDSLGYSSLYNDVIPANKYSSVRTIIEVTLSLDTSMYDVYMRTGTDDPYSEKGLVRGVSKTLYVATQRIMSDLSSSEWTSHIMSRVEIVRFHNALLGVVNDGLKHEKRTSLPAKEGGAHVRVVASTKPNVRPELGLYDRCAMVSHMLTSDGPGRTRVSTVAAVANETDVPKVDGEVLVERQGDGVTRLLPLAHTVDVPVPGSVYGDKQNIGSVFPTAGLGTFMGTAAVGGKGGVRRGRERVFVDFGASVGDILYVQAPVEVQWALVGRLGVSGLRVGVLSGSKKIRRVVSGLGVKSVGVQGTSAGVDVVVMGEELWSKVAKLPSQLVVAVGDEVPMGAGHSLVVGEDGRCVLSFGGKRTAFFWDWLDGERVLVQRSLRGGR